MRIPAKFLPEHSNVLGPKMQTFAWDFSNYYPMYQRWGDFRKTDAKWLQQLAEYAIAHKAALTKIEIQFQPVYPRSLPARAKYPWDLMDDLRDRILRPNGMDLVYNEPIVTKEQWLGLAESTKQSGGDVGGEGLDSCVDIVQRPLA
jgi:hypothetical protein